MPILSFADKNTEVFFQEGKLGKGIGWANCAKIVMRKLDHLKYAGQLGDLASPPHNYLEALKGDMVGRHSIRINDQWRIVFRWTAAGPCDVSVMDYH